MAIQLEQVKQKTRSFMRKVLLFGSIIFLVAFVGYYFWRTYEYSEGSRAGLLFKISKKGYVFKTYEGQLHVGNTMMINDQSLFNFSVKDEGTYKQMQQFEGKNVKIYYKELNDAFPWQGDTDYMVYRIEPVNQ